MIDADGQVVPGERPISPVPCCISVVEPGRMLMDRCFMSTEDSYSNPLAQCNLLYYALSHLLRLSEPYSWYQHDIH